MPSNTVEPKKTASRGLTCTKGVHSGLSEVTFIEGCPHIRVVLMKHNKVAYIYIYTHTYMYSGIPHKASIVTEYSGMFRSAPQKIKPRAPVFVFGGFN